MKSYEDLPFHQVPKTGTDPSLESLSFIYPRNEILERDQENFPRSRVSPSQDEKELVLFIARRSREESLEAINFQLYLTEVEHRRRYGDPKNKALYKVFEHRRSDLPFQSIYDPKNLHGKYLLLLLDKVKTDQLNLILVLYQWDALTTDPWTLYNLFWEISPSIRLRVYAICPESNEKMFFEPDIQQLCEALCGINWGVLTPDTIRAFCYMRALNALAFPFDGVNPTDLLKGYPGSEEEPQTKDAQVDVEVPEDP